MSSNILNSFPEFAWMFEETAGNKMMRGVSMSEIIKERKDNLEVAKKQSKAEIKEVEESFGKNQVGSSTMPQKRNPHKSENLCGIARVLRSNVAVALENIALEHERDLTNSSAERIILPESMLLIDYSLKQLVTILNGLKVYPKRMKMNLENDPYVMSESIMLALVKRGVPRQEAHRIVKKAAMKAFVAGKNYKEVIVKATQPWMSEKDVVKSMDPYSYLGESEKRIDKVMRECK